MAFYCPGLSFFNGFDGNPNELDESAVIEVEIVQTLPQFQQLYGIIGQAANWVQVRCHQSILLTKIPGAFSSEAEGVNGRPERVIAQTECLSQVAFSRSDVFDGVIVARNPVTGECRVVLHEISLFDEAWIHNQPVKEGHYYFISG